MVTRQHRAQTKLRNAMEDGKALLGGLSWLLLLLYVCFGSFQTLSYMMQLLVSRGDLESPQPCASVTNQLASGASAVRSDLESICEVTGGWGPKNRLLGTRQAPASWQLQQLVTRRDQAAQTGLWRQTACRAQGLLFLTPSPLSSH